MKKTQKKPKRDATTKQRKYVAHRIAGKNKKEAALAAGYTPGVAHNAKQLIESKPAVKELLQSAMDAEGISAALIARRMREGLDANIIHFETMHSEREVCVDFRERREMLSLISEIQGLKAPEKHEHSGTLSVLLLESEKSVGQ